MTNDLSNREQQIEDYLKKILAQSFAKTDLRSDGEFMETFALPHIKMFEPVLDFIDKIRLMQSLENAQYLSVEEMDELARVHYKTRDMGEASYGVLTLIFDDMPNSGKLVIPYGKIAISKKDMRYQSTETITLEEDDLSAFFDTSSFTYRIPVQFEAVSTGTEYDAEPGEINQLEDGNMLNLVEVINETPFINGVDAETNLELAQRIRNESMTPNLGIERGYLNFLNTFSNVSDAKVVGYMHPLMRRDIIGEVEIPGVQFHENIRELHWGTKIDLYVRGELGEVVTEFLEVQNTPDGDLYVQLKNVPVLDIVDVQMYSISGEFDDPNLKEESLYLTNYTLVKDEEFETLGTLQEDAKLFLYEDALSKGKIVQVNYRYNRLIKDIHTTMHEDDNRPPTADVKTKEARKKYVYGAFVAGFDSNIGIRESQKSVINQQLSRWIDSYATGEELQFSDLLTPITEQPDAEGIFVDFIHLPFQAFVTENKSRYIYHCMNEQQRGIIDNFEVTNSLLHNVFKKYKDTLTTFDFFDLLHSLTNTTGYETAANELAYKEGDWSEKINAFTRIRKMILMAQVSASLSPDKRTIQENEFFVLGESFIYEAKDYDLNDWERMVNLFWNIAKDTEEEGSITDMYYNAVYLLSIVYLLTNGTNVSEKGLLSYLRKVLVSTPIEFDFEV